MIQRIVTVGERLPESARVLESVLARHLAQSE
jgi:hypothetical protein